MARRRKARKARSRKSERPLGVAVISVLNWIGAIIAIVLGFGFLTLGTLSGLIPLAGIFLGAVGFFLGVVLLAVGVVSLVVTYWLWNLEKRGWTWVMIFNVIIILLNLSHLNIFGIVIPLIVAAYLWGRKNFFR